MSATTTGKQFWTTLVNPEKTFASLFNEKVRVTPILYVIACVWLCLNRSLQYSAETYFGSSFFTSLLLCLATGWIWFYLGSVLINATGNALGNKAKTESSKMVFMWSFAPGLIAIVLFSIAILIYGSDVMNGTRSIGSLALARNVLISINLALGIWGAYILIRGMMLIHRISVPKAVLTILLPLVIWCLIAVIL